LSYTYFLFVDIVPIQDRGKYQGIIGATFAVSSVVGPLLGGVFVDHLTWNWLFFINLPIGNMYHPSCCLFYIGLLCMAVLIYGVKVTPFKLNLLKSVDYLGTILIVAAVVCAVLAASWGGDQYAWNSGVVISLFIVAGILFAAFVYPLNEPELLITV
jgi:MFS family permease